MSNIFDIDLAQKHPFATSMVTSAVSRDRLSHAYLLSGRAIGDKWVFAQQLAAYLNCSSRIGVLDEACQLAKRADICTNCKWISDGKHPQAWLTLTKDGSKSGTKIAVEKARALCDELSKHSEYFRIVIVEDASQEVFHRPSANALLKTIEDPGSRCLFILFADREEDVLPTVVSRCQVIPLQNAPEKPSALAQAILKTGGADSQAPSPELKALSDGFKQIFKARDSHLNLYALDLVRHIQIAIDELENPSLVLDYATNLEISRVGERAGHDSTAAGYLADLLSLAEEVKLQLQHYVSPKAAIETFVLSWWRLRRAAGC